MNYARRASMCFSLAATCLLGCGLRPPQDEAQQSKLTAEDFPPAEHDYFAGMDGVAGEEPGKLKLLDLTAEEIKGRNAWMMWTGGNEAFWDWLARHGYGTMDLLRLLDSRERDTRFARGGLITEPDTRPPTEEETRAAYGIRYDRPVDPTAQQPNPKVYGYSSGIVGLRLFPNPEFEGASRAAWDPARYYADPLYASHPNTIRPFRVGMSCAFCHAAPHPLNPPSDPESPTWENLSGSIGNQYMRVREVFGNLLDENNFLYHVLDSQLPGTIDTSLVASDNINNANTMNAVFGVPWRVERALRNCQETLGPESAAYPGLWAERDAEVWNTNPRSVPRVLLDGSDSVGVWVALARVYLNIGTYHQQWIRLHNPLLGFRTQQPFKLADCEANSTYWQATKLRVEPMAQFFLKSTAPMRLKDAPGGIDKAGLQGEGVPWDPAYAKGRKVFAGGCIACHSSIQPGDLSELEKKIAVPGVSGDRSALRLRLDDLTRLTRGDGKLPPAYAAWAESAVEHRAFWERNYLSTDMRIPVTLTRTNSARAMATNAIHGNMWEDFSSLTYKELDSVGSIRYRDPFSGSNRSFRAPAGGPGYYRVPTLISIWATAPLFHNNALGTFNNDPSVAGRLNAFDDAIRKFLWPENRLAQSDFASSEQLKADGGLVWRTSNDSSFILPGHHIPDLFRGITGWSPFWVAVVPWLPAIGFALLGTVLLFSRPIISLRERLDGYSSSLAKVLSHARIWAAVIAVVLAGGAFILAWQQQPMLEVLEAMSGWRFPWLRAQAFLPAAFLLSFAVLFTLHKLPIRSIRHRVAHTVGAVCLVLAVFVGLGFGRFLSGLGGELKLGPFPAGIPVNVIANMSPEASLEARMAALDALIDYLRDWHRSPPGEKPGRREFEQRVAPALMAVSKCPDFVMDRGHDYEFIRRWSDDEKEALIGLLKTF